MIKYFKIFLIMMVSILSLSVFASQLQADETADPYPFVYLFHLYYDNGQLFADKDFEFKYDLIAESFVQQQLNNPALFRGEVVSVSDNVIGGFEFDPTITKGKISVKGPYFSNAGKVNFYNDKSELLLTLVVSESSVCNENGICNSDVGEDNANCPNDCKAVEIPVEASGFDVTRAIFIALAAAAGLFVLWMVWTIIKKRKTGSDVPPPAIQ